MAEPADLEPTFYTITDRGFFPATVGLLNSLRLTDHRSPLIVLDCGLTPRQRGLLSEHAALVPYERERATNPGLFKPFAVLTEPDGVVVVIDSDVVVTGSLKPVVRDAGSGRIVAVPDPDVGRWFGEWEEVFGLAAPPRRQPYVNTGFVAFSADRWPDLLPRWWEACRRIWSRPSMYEGGGRGPTGQADQDALNAILMSEVPSEALALLPREVAPMSRAGRRGTKVVDPRTLSCTFRGTPTLFLQSTGRPKPWNPLAWKGGGHGAYVRMLRRVLAGPDVVLRVADEELPPWLRRGAWGAVSLTALRATSWTAARAVGIRARRSAGTVSSGRTRS
jgi:hypothetical protein